MRIDIFICHAKEDKVSVVRPLEKCLRDRGISYWTDEVEIALGESITERVNEGLKNSDFVVVILSRAFMSKNWPKKELWSVLNREATSGKVIILPILVGTQTEIDGIVKEFPLLNDKKFLVWNGDADRAAHEIQNTVLKSRGEPQAEVAAMQRCGHCQTPFQHGVHACLGCGAQIVYGLTPQERRNVRLGAVAVLSLLALLFGALLPSDSLSTIGLKFPMIWGVVSWAIPATAVLVIAGAFYAEYKIVKMKAHLIRTIR